MNRRQILLLLVVAVLTLGWAQGTGAQHQPVGELVYAMHVTIPPAWFDPAENGGLITPFAVLYALHDGVVRPMPGAKIGNSLAESWTESADGLVYEFKLRQGLRFHNDEPCTAEDVKLSFGRYKGGGASELRANVQRVEVVDPLTVRFHMKEPWPDFLTFYGTSAAAADRSPMLRVQTWPRPPLRRWGIPPTHLHRSLGRHLPRAMMPTCMKYQSRT
jgi:peptide/nickel transport system substrate-binding protein